jgi:hypothetical protein
MTKGKVNKYIGDCQGQSGTMQEAEQLLAAHFEKYGYDASSLSQTTFDQ